MAIYYRAAVSKHNVKQIFTYKDAVLNVHAIVIYRRIQSTHRGSSLSGMENCRVCLPCSSSRSCRYTDGPLPQYTTNQQYLQTKMHGYESTKFTWLYR